MTNSMDPVKMNALMHMGHRNENPRVPMSTPYDVARKKKLTHTGSVLGNAVVRALMMDVVLLRASEAKCLLLSGMSVGFCLVFGHLRLAVFVKRLHWYRRRL